MEHVGLEFARRPDGTLRVALGGDWKLARGLPAPRSVIEEIETAPLPRKVILETGVLAGWDSDCSPSYWRSCRDARSSASRSIGRGCPEA